MRRLPLAVVTGTGRGLGRALAAGLVTRGWEVVAVQRPSPGAAAGTVRNPAGDAFSRRVSIVKVDLRAAHAAAEVVCSVGGRPVDVLINNAVSGAPGGDVATVDPDLFATALAVNVTAPLRLAGALTAHLLAAPHPAIINVSSRLGSIRAQADGAFAGFGTSYAYRVSKAALNMLTVCLADEFDTRVRCYSVHPGQLKTDTGRPGAQLKPAVAAHRIIDLLGRHDLPSPQFFDLGSGTSLDW